MTKTKALREAGHTFIDTQALGKTPLARKCNTPLIEMVAGDYGGPLRNGFRIRASIKIGKVKKRERKDRLKTRLEP